MKLTPPANENYAATIVYVRTTVPLPKSDYLVGVPLLGYQAIVSKDTEVDVLAVLFTAETQLSVEYTATNNLHRHTDLNADQSKAGYLEDNRRVRAIRLRGNASNALLMPLSSLAYTGANVAELVEGDVFDQLNGHDICRKYEVVVLAGTPRAAQPKAAQRVDEVHFPKHFDTANYFRNTDQIHRDDDVVMTQKLHGTSVRFSHTIVRRKQTWKDRIAKRFGVAVQDTTYDYVYGSRNVTKDPDNPFAAPGFYSEDVYSQVGKRFKGSIPKGYVVYGEIIGWVGTSAIQPGFTYGLPVGSNELYVYRVVHVNPSGRAVDLGWDQVKAFCAEIGAKHVPELERGSLDSEAAVYTYLDIRFADFYPQAVPTDGTVDEGICIRKEGAWTPLVLKAKSPKFLELETKALDAGVADMESVG